MRGVSCRAGQRNTRDSDGVQTIATRKWRARSGSNYPSTHSGRTWEHARLLSRRCVVVLVDRLLENTVDATPRTVHPPSAENEGNHRWARSRGRERPAPSIVRYELPVALLM